MPTYYNFGDAVDGERITCQFRRISKPKLVSGTHRHRAWEVTLDDACCVIMKPRRFKQG